MGPGDSQLPGGTQARATDRTVRLASGRWGTPGKQGVSSGAYQRASCRSAEAAARTSAAVALRPAPPQPPHLCPSLGILQTGPHSRDGLGILKMPQRRPKLVGAAWSLERSGRGDGSPPSCPRELELKDLHVHPGMTFRIGGRVTVGGTTSLCAIPGFSHTPTMCLALAEHADLSEGGPVPNFVEFIVNSGRQRRDEYSEETSRVQNGDWRGDVLVGWERPWVSEGPKAPGGKEGGVEDS